MLACSSRKPEPAPPAILGPVDQGADQIGQKAPSLEGVRWLGTESGKGKLHLVRWWTDGCSLCSSSAPELSRLAATHNDLLRFSVIFHDKHGRDSIDDAWLRETAAATGFESCRIGIDPGWGALKRWWLDRGGRRFTSVTFLLDASGEIRLIHTGGTVTPEEAKGIDRMIRHIEERG